jgi:nitroreductase
MELKEAIKGRRSIRKFKPVAVEKKVLTEILEDCRWAPSWGNTQPWELFVLTGPALERFRKDSLEKTESGEPFSPDVPMPEAWPEHMKARYAGLGKIVLTAQGIAREDKAARVRYYKEMLSFFGAPCLVIAAVPGDVRLEYAMLDIGLLLQTLCLAAYDRGIGSCIMAATVGYPGLLRKILPIPANRRIIMGVALGYPDPDFPLNRFARERAALDDFVTWVE